LHFEFGGTQHSDVDETVHSDFDKSENLVSDRSGGNAVFDKNVVPVFGRM
jgi:hypothetical protein